MNVLDRFSAAGVRFRLDGERVFAKLTVPVTDEIRAAMKALKEEIKSELVAIETRRQHLLARLAEQPGQQYVVVYDTDASTEYDVLVLAIPSHTFEIRVPKLGDSLDFACRLMQSMDTQTAGLKDGLSANGRSPSASEPSPAANPQRLRQPVPEPSRNQTSA